ncbi:MAG: UPF0104 family protein [Candidatus Promineofilum sp.]|nr:UPF0104 family protein [Promineifilum sp.]
MMDPNPTRQPELRPARIPAFSIHLLRFIVMVVMVGLGVRLLLPQIADLEDAVTTIRAMPLWLVGIAALGQVGNYGGAGVMMATLAGLVDSRLPLLRGTIIAIAASSIGLVAGGTVGNTAITYRWVRGSGVRRLGAALCATIPLLLIVLALLLVAMVGLINLLLVHQLNAVEVAGFVAVLVMLGVLAAVVFYGMAHPPWLTARVTPILVRYYAWRRRPFAPEDAVDYVNKLINTGIVLRRGWHGPAAGAVINITSDIFTLYILFLAAGYRVSPGLLLAGYGLPLLVGRLPLVPGGVGVVEATMTAVFIGLGAPPHATVVATLGYRLFSFWIPTLLGFPLALYLQHVARPPEETPNAPAGTEKNPQISPITQIEEPS